MTPMITGSPKASTASRKMFRGLIVFVILICHFFFSYAQTNISGVVNSYHKVIKVIPSMACVRVSSVTGLARLQKVMIVQMKGASIVTANTSAFGDTTSLNEAGNYEIAVICAINGDSVFLFHNLLNNYTVNDKVQLVRFAEYFSANVVDTIKAAPWDSTTGTGGVIAIHVSQTLELNAPVYADSSGFRGGPYVLSSGDCSNFTSTGYIYNAALTGPQSGSYKGESVYNISSSSQTGGRGAPANGGGGGNNHNNGAGGGAHLSVGGRGGGNSSSMGCTLNLRGEAGKALTSWNGKKIFFGGGGGAGHSNGILTVSKGGGNGGGIIFIHATTITGNGQRITAGGGNGGNAVSDGASGGGAGGTIIMDVSNYSGPVTIQANGGKGGDADDAGTVNRCYGAGGGGSGGVIYFTGSIPAISNLVNGGVAGIESARSAGCNAAIPALNGANGSILSSFDYAQATDSASYCLTLTPLPVLIIYFKAIASQKNVTLRWKIGYPETVKEFIPEKKASTVHWEPLGIIPATGSNENYSYIDENPGQGINLYRIKIIEKNNSVTYSPVQKVMISETNELFDIYPNPANSELLISGDLSSAITIQLSDLAGKILWQKKLSPSGNSIRVELPAVSRGIYLLKINNEVKKIVIR